MISNHKFLMLLVLFNQIVSPVKELKLNSKLRALCKHPANAFSYKNPSKLLFFRVFSLFYNIIYKMQNIENIDSSKTKYVLPCIIIEKVNEFLPIRLSKENLKQLKKLNNILQITPNFLAALRASTERLKTQGDGKRVIGVQPIYHKGKQLPGCWLILEDGSKKIVTRVEYLKEKNTIHICIYQTLIVLIENIHILDARKLPFMGTLQIDNTEIIDEEKHYKNSLSEEEIKRYDRILCCTIEYKSENNIFSINTSPKSRNLYVVKK